MLPEAGAFELVFLAMVALIVVGPKDLPVLLRKVGQFTAKMRGLAGEFRASFDEMARQSELDELRREVEALREGRFGEGAKPDLESHLSDIHGSLSFQEPSTHAALSPAATPEALPAPALSFDAEPEPELPLPVPASHEPAPHVADAGPPRVEPAH